jgi:Uma2 family endonuclease
MVTLTRISVAELLAGPIRTDVELIDGEEVVTDPRFEHQRVVLRLLMALGLWIRGGRDRGEAGFGGNWELGTDSVLKPDAWWVNESTRLTVDGSRTSAAPEIAIEVRSRGTAGIDLGRKKDIYEQAGVVEYWFVDIAARSVIVWRRSSPSAPRFDDVDELDAEDRLTSPLLEGFDLSLDTLFPQ